MKKKFTVLLLFLFLATGCGRDEASSSEGISLAEARRGFQTQLVRPPALGEPVPAPPTEAFLLVHYDSPAGKLAAYLTPDPQDGGKHPAIIWITGGDSNTIGDLWTPMPEDNDQTARAYRDAGVVMMFPSLRGGNDNPGTKEGFLGEVDDIAAAADHLARQPFVDPQRIYLGGHSTGGTLVLLAAESTDRFRAVFSFGPVYDVSVYGSEYLPFDASDEREIRLRSPGYWLHSIRSPVFVFEGTEESNLESLLAMESESDNPSIHFHSVQGADHFNVLAPTNRLIAQKIVRDKGAQIDLSFTEDELNQPFR